LPGPNYAFTKRQKELAKKQRKEAKRQRKAESAETADVAKPEPLPVSDKVVS
jgi:hypothetical protein